MKSATATVALAALLSLASGTAADETCTEENGPLVCTQCADNPDSNVRAAFFAAHMHADEVLSRQHVSQSYCGRFARRALISRRKHGKLLCKGRKMAWIRRSLSIFTVTAVSPRW